MSLKNIKNIKNLRLVSKKHARQYAKYPSRWSFMPDAVEKEYDEWCSVFERNNKLLNKSSIAIFIYEDFEDKKNNTANEKTRATMEKNMDWVINTIGVPGRGAQLH